MERRFFDYDPLTGDREYFYFDHVTKQSIIERVNDVEPLLELNKALANETPGNWKGDMHHVASIPSVVWQELKKQGIADEPDRLRAWLNDRDNQLFRTRPGRV